MIQRSFLFACCFQDDSESAFNLILSDELIPGFGTQGVVKHYVVGIVLVKHGFIHEIEYSIPL